MLGAHRAESRPGPALSSQAPTGPHLASPGSRQLPTNMKLFLHCESLVICPPDTLAQLSLVSRKRGRVADVAVITWALSGAGDQAVFYFPLVTRSRWHRNKSLCVGMRKILFDQFSFKYFLLKPSIKIDHQYVASGYMGLKVRLNESWVPISILEYYLVDRDLAWGRHILCLDVFCGLLCYSYSDIHVVVIQEIAFSEGIYFLCAEDKTWI